MRRKRLEDETKALQEKLMEERRIKKMKEIEEAAKNNKKIEEYQFFTYGFQGEYIDIVRLNSLPNLAPGCFRTPGSMSGEDTSFKASSNKLRRLSTRLPLIEGLIPSLRENKLNTELISPCIGCYQYLSPALGVTFTEQGKEPKKLERSINKHTERLTRTEFKLMVTDPPFETVQEKAFKEELLGDSSNFWSKCRVGR